MSDATYKYSLKSASGYKSDQSGAITPERHGVVCAALAGKIPDDLDLLRAAPDLLVHLILAAETLRRYETLHRAKNTEESTVKADVNADLAARFEATIAKAKGGAQ